MLRRAIAVACIAWLLVAGFAAVSSTEAGAVPVVSGAGGVVPLAPARLLDTRNDIGAARPNANTAVSVQVTGQGGVPASGVSAVVLNVTVTRATKPGYITVYGAGNARPAASNLNFSAGQTVPNLVLAPVGANGKVTLYNGSAGPADLLADVSGFIRSGEATAPGSVTPLTPARLLDTRNNIGAARPNANTAVSVQVTGQGGVPASGVSAVVLNVTVTRATKPGYITVYGAGNARPAASNLNFSAGQTVPNLVLAPVGANGKVTLYNGSAGPADLLADVSGFIRSGEATAPGSVTPLTPARLLDTRNNIGAARPNANTAVSVQVTGQGGVPASGVSAVVLNVTVTRATKPGYITVYGAGNARPAASNLNFSAGQTVPNLVLAPVGANGKVTLYNGSAGPADLLADVSGYVTAEAGLQWAAPTTIDPSFGQLQAVSCPTTSSCVAVDTGGGALTLNGSTWSAPKKITNTYLYAVSCASPSFCVAAGDSGSATMFNGTNWSTPQTIASGAIYSVSCPTSSFCAAIDGQGEAVTYNGTAWSTPTSITTSVLYGVSCVSATYCVAVDNGGRAITYDGTSWSTPEKIDVTSALSDVSCWAVASCVAVDEAGNATTLTADGWTAPQTVAPVGLGSVSCTSAASCTAVGGPYASTLTGATWTASNIKPNGGLTSVSCPSATRCVAVDDQGDALTYDGTSWSAPTRIQAPFARTIRSLSCPTVDFCAAIDDVGRAITYNGTSWNTPVQVIPVAAPQVAGLAAVSCTSATFCLAVTGNGKSTRYDGTSWSTPAATGEGALGDVSCATTTACVAVGRTGAGIRYNGTTWSAPFAVADATTNQLITISCVSATTCVAISVQSAAFTLAGTTWSAPTTLEPRASGVPDSVSCTSTTFCAAVDNAGNAFTYNGSSWSTPVPVDTGYELRDISCASQLFCVAVGSHGTATIYNGSTWSASTIVTNNQTIIDQTLSVACPAERQCFVGDSAGRVFASA